MDQSSKKFLLCAKEHVIDVKKCFIEEEARSKESVVESVEKG